MKWWTSPGGSLTEADSVLLSCSHTFISVKIYFLTSSWWNMLIVGIDLIN